MLYIKLKYNIENNKFDVESNIRDKKRVITNYLRNLNHEIEDSRAVADFSEYEILLKINLDYDIIEIEDNCNNNNFRNEILIKFLNV